MQLEDLEADEARKKAQHEMHEALRIANEAMEEKKKNQKEFAKQEDDQVYVSFFLLSVLHFISLLTKSAAFHLSTLSDFIL